MWPHSSPFNARSSSGAPSLGTHAAEGLGSGASSRGLPSVLLSSASRGRGLSMGSQDGSAHAAAAAISGDDVAALQQLQQQHQQQRQRRRSLLSDVSSRGSGGWGPGLGVPPPGAGGSMHR